MSTWPDQGFFEQKKNPALPEPMSIGEFKGIVTYMQSDPGGILHYSLQDSFFCALFA
jgi:hypothetical protein